MIIREIRSTKSGRSELRIFGMTAGTALGLLEGLFLWIWDRSLFLLSDFFHRISLPLDSSASTIDAYTKNMDDFSHS